MFECDSVCCCICIIVLFVIVIKLVVLVMKLGLFIKFLQEEQVKKSTKKKVLHRSTREPV